MKNNKLWRITRPGVIIQKLFDNRPVNMCGNSGTRANLGRAENRESGVDNLEFSIFRFLFE